MAKQVQLSNDLTVNGEVFLKGDIITVCDELFEELGLPEFTPTSDKKAK